MDRSHQPAESVLYKDCHPNVRRLHGKQWKKNGMTFTMSPSSDWECKQHLLIICRVFWLFWFEHFTYHIATNQLRTLNSEITHTVPFLIIFSTVYVDIYHCSPKNCLRVERNATHSNTCLTNVSWILHVKDPHNLVIRVLLLQKPTIIRLLGMAQAFLNPLNL